MQAEIIPFPKKKCPCELCRLDRQLTRDLSKGDAQKMRFWLLDPNPDTPPPQIGA